MIMRKPDPGTLPDAHSYASGARFGLAVSAQQAEGYLEPAALRALVTRAETLGFDSLWVTDHISFRNPVLEAVVALTAVAAWTERVALGTGVMLLPLRHPSLVAKQIASLDALSGGRVILGVGIGGEGEKDFEAVGVPREARGRRSDEALDVLRRLWRERPASHHGRFFSFSEVTIEPPPHQPGGPPIWIGGRSPAALRRVAQRGDGWLAYFASPRRFATDWAEVKRLSEAAGRDPAELTPALTSTIAIRTDSSAARQALAEHLTRRYHQPFDPERVGSLAIAGSPAECLDRVSQYLEAGVRHLTFLLSGPADGACEEAEELYRSVVEPLRQARIGD